MESPLEVLSRAATMVQDSSADTRLTSKELPTTKWRRDRRIRMSSEYHAPTSPASVKPLSESNSTNSPNSNSNGGGGGGATSSNVVGITAPAAIMGVTNINALNSETPLDMSVASKPRTPPPPYREPLPGSTFATSIARPSVITQAPKREIINANQENKDSSAMAVESISMVDPVIDEHFRRSLGADYVHLFGNKKPNGNVIKPIATKKTNLTTIATSPMSPGTIIGGGPASPTVPVTAAAIPQSSPVAVTMGGSLSRPTSAPPPPSSSPPPVIVLTTEQRGCNSGDEVDPTVGMSVDDHFAKALGGDTWKQLQRADSKNDDRNCVKQ